MKKRLLFVMITVLTAAVVAYLGLALFFTKHFYFNTIINGENYSVSAVNFAQDCLLDTSSQYVLTINGRDGLTDTITAADIGLQVEFQNEFEDIMEGQQAFLWPFSIFKKAEYTVDTMVTYSREALDEKIDALCFFESRNIRQPQDAYVSDYGENGFQIVPEDKGAVPIREKVRSAVEQAVTFMEESVDLDAEECYVNARITSDNRVLQQECDERNRFAGVTITYTFGEDTELLDGSIIKDWMTVDGSAIDLDAESVREYVNGLARKYDTWGKKREFRTTNGEVITIANGEYGWWMNRAEETQALIEQIKSGVSGDRTPVYRAEAAQYGEDDIGDSYVEIDLTSQHLWVYKDGQLIEETDFVSGNVSKGYGTPVGIYGITYKERNATLRGANYASPVSYWMPFNGNVGMHDASWRSSFGEDIYLTNGSHGCVNLPVKKAAVIYENVEKGEPVIVYGGKTIAVKPEPADEPQTPDSGDSADAGTPSEAGQPQDMGTPQEAEMPSEAGQPQEAGMPSEAGQPQDTGMPQEVGMSSEGQLQDANVPQE